MLLALLIIALIDWLGVCLLLLAVGFCVVLSHCSMVATNKTTRRFSLKIHFTNCEPQVFSKFIECFAPETLLNVVAKPKKKLKKL